METTTADLITSFEAGLILRKSARTVQRMARTEDNPHGLLPVAQKLPGPNGAYLFRREDVESLAPCPHPDCTNDRRTTLHFGAPCPNQSGSAA